MVFALFGLKTGKDFVILVWILVWFSREFGSAWTYLSFQSQINKKERAICKFEMKFKKSFCWRSNLLNLTNFCDTGEVGGGGVFVIQVIRCRPQGYSFCAVWVWKLVQTLPTYFGLKLGMVGMVSERTKECINVFVASNKEERKD